MSHHGLVHCRILFLLPILWIGLAASAPGEATPPADAAVLEKFIRESVRFRPSTLPVVRPGESRATLALEIENPGGQHPATRELQLEVAFSQDSPETALKQTVAVPRLATARLKFDFQLSDGAKAEISAGLPGQRAHTASFRALNWRRREWPVLRASPHGEWIRNLAGDAVILFQGPGPSTGESGGSVSASDGTSSTSHSDAVRPFTVAAITSAAVWDDYYLPDPAADTFLAQLVAPLRDSAVIVDATSWGLAPHVLAEVVDAVSARRPDLILLSLGGHEDYSEPDPQLFENAFEATIDRLQTLSRARIVILSQPPSLRGPEGFRPAAEVARRMARQHGLEFIDTAEILAGGGTPLGDLFGRMMPNAQAHGLIARALAARLKDFLPAGRKARKQARAASPAVPQIDASAPPAVDVLRGRIPPLASEQGSFRWEEVSGRLAHAHPASPQQSLHGFQNGFPLKVPADAEIVQEVFLPAEGAPKALMIAFTSLGRYAPAQGIDGLHQPDALHRAFWGGPVITLGQDQKGRGYLQAGPLPAAGQWAELAVKAVDLGLEGRYLSALNFVTSNGLAWWGRTRVRTARSDSAWVDAAFPVGGQALDWAWREEEDKARPRAHFNLPAQMSNSYAFEFKSPIPVPDRFTFIQEVRIDPECRPEEMALHIGGARHVWGRFRSEDWHASGHPASWSFYHGPLPPSGNWTRLEIPVAEAALAASLAVQPEGSRVYPFRGNAIREVRFEARHGRAYWGLTAFSPATRDPAAAQQPKTAPPSTAGPESHVPAAGPFAWLSTHRTGNVLFDGQAFPLRLTVANRSADTESFSASVRLLDLHGEEVMGYPPARIAVPGRGEATVPFAWEGSGRGFFTAVAAVEGPSGRAEATTTLARLPSNVNLAEKPIFMYENSGYFRDIFRLMDLTATGRCRSMGIEQEQFRIRSYDDTPCRGREPGTEPLLSDYRDARELAARRKGTPLRPRFWFTISSDEQNLNWHNLERWSETIRCTALGLKASDPDCIVSTPEINSIAMGFIEKLGENHTFDYLDLYDTYGCSLPVPPEWTNKYWLLDTAALAIMNETFGHRLTQTGLQYSTGNHGRCWGIPEEHQAAYYVRGDILRRADRVDLISYFKFRECPNVNIFEVKDAITHFDLTPKPAFVALCTAFARLDRARYLGRFHAGRGNHLHLFEKPDDSGLLLVAWTTEPAPQKVLLDTHSSRIEITDMLGRARGQETARGIAALRLTGEPIYIDGLAPAVTAEDFFEPASLLRPIERRERALRRVFLAIENHRKAEDGYGDAQRTRGDFVRVAGDTFSVKVNVYNLGDQPARGEVRLALPLGLLAKPESLPFQLEPVSAATLTFSVEIPLDVSPGLGRIVATGAAEGLSLDDFTSDLLVLSPLQVLPIEGPPEPGTRLQVRFTNPSWRAADADLRLVLPPGWRVDPEEIHLASVAAGGVDVARFVLVETRPLPFHAYPVTVTAKVGAETAVLSDNLDFATIAAVTRPPVLDGRLDDWPDAVPLDYGQKANNYIYLQLREMLDRTNFSATIRALHDPDNLYLSLDVLDDHICNEDTKHGIMWDMDAWEIKFDLNGDEQADGQVNVAPTGRSYFHPSDPRGDPFPLLTGGRGLVRVASKVYREARADRPRGYTIELAIPWRYFEGGHPKAEAGRQIGLAFFCVDEDFRSWSARPWSFDVGKKGFGWFVLTQPRVSFADSMPRAAAPRSASRARLPGDFASARARIAGLVFGQALAGDAERFPDTGLDLPSREKAGRLWFTGPGFVEYEFDFSGEAGLPDCEAIEFQAELSSCYTPGNTHYAMPGNPTEVALLLNGFDAGTYLCPGDPGVDGWLVTWRADRSGCHINGRRVLPPLPPEFFQGLAQSKVRARLSVLESSAYSRGGLKLYGIDSTGMHSTDLLLRVLWKD
ncbi:MAG: hypothetical protein HYU36_04380 [Planctomycetes bacterium]|nr:hypothetical protein [Planctomycetota bacterium]